MYIENQDFIVREENGFYLAYNYIAHTYYQLNKTAVILISEAIKYSTIDEIVVGVCAKTGDEPNKARNDIVQGLSQLMDIGILQYDE